MSLKGLELFAGGGGLLLGSSLAGIEHLAAAEWNKWACATIRENRDAGYPLVDGVKVLDGDVREVNWKEAIDGQQVDVISGGPPCQPFSLGGKSQSADDHRDMFPATTAVIEEVRPRAFVIENVKGLTRAAFSDYFEFIKLRLQHPEIRAREFESWTDHYARLQREHTSVKSDLKYNLVTRLVNAADYGVPQHRHRIFLVGFREDVDAGFSFPDPTHSGAALAMSQTSGTYWDKHKVSKRDQHTIRRKPAEDHLSPWVTIREALEGLPVPQHGGTDGWLDHSYQAGAKIYPGHTGSPLDEPSKALKAGVHGVPGGENMIRFPDGTVRYFSTREAARIQTFPDRYALHGAWTEAMRQLGNAVPMKLAHTVMSAVATHLELDSVKKSPRTNMHALQSIKAVS